MKTKLLTTCAFAAMAISTSFAMAADSYDPGHLKSQASAMMIGTPNDNLGIDGTKITFVGQNETGDTVAATLYEGAAGDAGKLMVADVAKSAGQFVDMTWASEDVGAGAKNVPASASTGFHKLT